MEQDLQQYDSTKDRLDLVKDLISKAYLCQVDYGRWVLASLITVHGGAIFAIIQNSDKLPNDVMAACIPPLVAGLLLAILTGAFAWINYTIAARGYVRVLLSFMNGEPSDPSWRVQLAANLTMGLAVLTTVASTACFGIAARSGYAVLIGYH
jgi:xanthine/uracil permease